MKFTFLKPKRKSYNISCKHSFNDQVIIYPTEQGWDKIEEKFNSSYIDERRTDHDGYKDRLWNIIEDLGDLFYHGSDYIPSNFEVIEK